MNLERLARALLPALALPKPALALLRLAHHCEWRDRHEQRAERISHRSGGEWYAQTTE